MRCQVGKAVLLARLTDRDDVRIAHGLRDPRLAPETAPEGLVSRQVGLDDLQCDRGPLARGRPVDLAHAADTDQRIDPVLPEHGPDAVIGRML